MSTHLKAIKTQNLFIEIGTEEIPAGFLEAGSQQFFESVKKLLKEKLIPFNEEHSRRLYSPRRLVVFFSQVSEIQNDREEMIKGPPFTVAKDSKGEWTPSAKAFFQKNNAEISEAIEQDTEKGKYLFLKKKTKGQKTLRVLSLELAELIKNLRFPKSMHWGEGKIHFARPIRWLVALLGGSVIPIQLDEIQSGRKTGVYRWNRKPWASISKADLGAYKALLSKQGVFVDQDERHQRIRCLIDQSLGKGMEIRACDDALLTEVTNLVEWPNPAIGQWDARFLSIPSEVLSDCIKYHQKYLPIYAKGTEKLLPKFLVIFNGPMKILKTVIHGNERVLRARLSDAAFFWEQDQKRSLENRVEDLKNVMFQEKLGTYYDKMTRLKNYCDVLTKLTLIEGTEAQDLLRSATLCKADLVSAMVGEFPNLQGVIGSEYAKLGGETPSVVGAIKEHYWPLSATEGELPHSRVGQWLAIIDKLDTIIVSFRAGLVPTGSQDPYGLRRTSSGLLRIIYENNINVSLSELIQSGVRYLDEKEGSKLTGQALADTIFAFFRERLENLFLNLRFRHGLVRSVCEKHVDRPHRAYKILKDLNDKVDCDFFSQASTVLERTGNIIKSANKKFGGSDDRVREELLKEKEEIELYSLYQSNYDGFSLLADQENFVAATQQFSHVFFEPVNRFFDKVLVNVEDPELRSNRYRLLRKVHESYSLRIADISSVRP